MVTLLSEVIYDLVWGGHRGMAGMISSGLPAVNR
jgi:hypothetical protein